MEEASASRATARGPQSEPRPPCLQSDAVKPMSVESESNGPVPELRWRSYRIPKSLRPAKLGTFPLFARALRQSKKKELEHPHCPWQPSVVESFYEFPAQTLFSSPRLYPLSTVKQHLLLWRQKLWLSLLLQAGTTKLSSQSPANGKNLHGTFSGTGIL